ncbi:MAG: hypothetical protein QM765_43945 [Myxococcales bacterium]
MAGPGLDAGESVDAAQLPGSDAQAVAGPDAEVDAAMPPDAAQPDAGPRCEPPCSSGEACLETTCVTVAFNSLCGLAGAVVLLDGKVVDDEVAAGIGQSVADACGGALPFATASLGDPTVFDPASGRLVTPFREARHHRGRLLLQPARRRARA